MNKKHISLFIKIILLIGLFSIPVSATEQTCPPQQTISGDKAIEYIKNGIKMDNFIIEGNINLTGETFFYPVIIENSVIKGELILGDDVSGENKTVFKQKVSLNNTNVEKDITAWYVNFLDDVDFSYAKFSGEVTFAKSEFFGDANFWSAEFFRNILLGYSVFFKKALFDSSKFFGELNSEDTKFTKETSFAGADFYGNVKFMSTKFLGNADFASTKFLGNSTFFDSTFSKHVQFSMANFERSVVFYDTHFKGIFDLSSSNFNKSLIFNDTSFFKVTFESISIDKKFIRLNWESIANKITSETQKQERDKDCEKSNETIYCKKAKDTTKQYLFLSDIFRTNGQFDDANNAYYKYHLLEREFTTQKSSKFKSWLMDFSCGYGLKPLNTIMLGIIIVSLFAFLYLFIYSSININQEKDTKKTFLQKFGDVLFFSLSTFINNRNNACCPNSKYKFIFMTETILGYLTAAIFLMTLWSKFPK